MKIAIVHGPNFRYLEKRDPTIYGVFSIGDIKKNIETFLKKSSISIECIFFQSNHEGEIIDFLEEMHTSSVDGIICNFGAYTHTSLAIADCLAWINPIVVEVHISQIFAREPIRHTSMIAPHCMASISGCGIKGYIFALEAIAFRCGVLE